MQKEIIAPGIILYKNVMPNANKIIDEIESHPDLWVSGGIAESRVKYTNESNSVLNKEIRDVSVFGIKHILDKTYKTDNYIWMTEMCNLAFTVLEEDYAKYYSIRTPQIHDSYHLLKYTEGQHFMSHVDSQPGFERTLSTVYYFNNDYLGGDLYFVEFDVSIKADPKDCIVFPSIWAYRHSANPVTQGTKYSMVSFLT